MAIRESTFVNRYILIAFIVQIVGWIGLVATVDHSPGPVVVWVQLLPEMIQLLLLPLAVFSIPALGISLGIGWILSIVGFPPQSLPSLLIAQGDVLVFASAYVVAVGVAWGITRRIGSE